MKTPEVDMNDYDQLGCLHEMFECQVKKTPKAVAVVTDDGEETTFEELNRMSDILASQLQQNGVGINSVVGILMERSLEYVISVIGIHKAGGAYLPLEVSYPTQLLASVLEDASPLVVCTKNMFLGRFKKTNTKNIIAMDNWKTHCSSQPMLEPLIPVQVCLDDMAYTVYSSGTTGKPKGIQCPHRGAVFSYTWRHRAYPYKDGDREACNVFFVWEMLRPLIKGVTLFIIPDSVIYDPPKLVSFLHRFKITRMLFTPSLLQAVLEFKGLDLKESLKILRQIWFCGEVVTSNLRDRIGNLLPWIQLLNLYSISECHDVANADISLSMKSGEPRKFCPVGKIFPKVHVVVMDESQNVKAIGEPGEIYIGGPTLAIGYLNRPELNKERFVKRPSNVSSEVGGRLYRTGDWGFVLSDGSLEICGRCDSTVRIRGYSVELQAIERTLLDLPMVNSCCVLAYGQEGTEKYLVAYIVQKPSVETGVQVKPKSQTELRNLLKIRLPLYMIPSKFMFLEKIPILEASGKLDTKKLAEAEHLNKPDIFQLQDEFMTPTEKKMSVIWCKVLNLVTIDLNENFFDLGGHSLAATRVVSEINYEFKRELETSTIFQHPTVKSFSTFLEGAECVDRIDLIHELASIQITAPPDLDSKLRAFWESFKLHKQRYHFGKVLITGGTGFLGSHLIHELLHKTECVIYCIVRKSPTSGPLKRIIDVQKNYGLPEIEHQFKDRIVAVDGDVSLLNLGLSEDLYSALASDIDCIIHASAKVNLIFPFQALYKDNVLGTKNIIEFAFTSKVKPIHYISTNAVFADGMTDCREDSDMFAHVDRLENGYAQTKWLAEQLILRAEKCGLPTVIYRCGNLSGSTNRPSWNPSDFTLLMIQGALTTRHIPDIKWEIEVTPIDFAQKIVILLLLDLNSSVGKIYHIMNENVLPCNELWTIMAEKGYNLTRLQFKDWVQQVHLNQDLKPLSHLLQSLIKNEKYFTSLSKFKRVRLNEYIGRRSITYPVVDFNLFEKYLNYLSLLDFIPAAEKQRLNSETRMLDGVTGKIILVTGASSGIGAGIAEKLALCNARVVLAARNLERLEKLKNKLESAGAMNVMAMQIDITDSMQVKNAVDEIEKCWGPIDILINNAGCMYYQLMKKCDIAKMHQMVDVNCKGSLNCLAVVIKSMTQRKSGHIITITSDAGKVPFAGLSVYSGTKFFLEAVCSALRKEVVDDNIKVTCIQPGDVVSELRTVVTDQEAVDKYDYSDKIEILNASDVASAVVFALSQPAYCAVNEILIQPQQGPV